MTDSPIELQRPGGYSDEEQEIAALLRSAGAADRVAPDQLASIKERARQAWRGQVRRTAVRRGAARAALAMAAAVLLTIAVALLRLPPAPIVVAPLATVAAVVGDASLGPGNPAAAGVELRDGATLETGDSGRAALLLAAGHSVRVDVASSVRVESDRSLRLERGAVYVDVPAAASSAAKISIDTPLGRVTDVGTRFEVRLIGAENDTRDGDGAGSTGSAGSTATTPQALEVRVREGAVRLDTTAGSFEAAAGTELHVAPGAGADRADAATWGDDWRWVESVRPPLAIEGVTLQAFLDWAARESGRTWRFADAATRDDASGVVLHGSIEGLDVDEALSTVLPSCGLRHRVDGGVLLIESDRGL